MASTSSKHVRTVNFIRKNVYLVEKSVKKTPSKSPPFLHGMGILEDNSDIMEIYVNNINERKDVEKILGMTKQQFFCVKGATVDKLMRKIILSADSLTRIISLVRGTGAIVVNNTLKSIVGHNVSKTFNMIGTKGKESFAALQSINSVIKKGVRANCGMKETTDKDIASWCGRWFTNARDRKGDRLARRLEAAKPQIAEDVLPVEDVLLVEEEIVGADSD